MEEQHQRALDRIEYVTELSAFYGTSFEQELSRELAREALCGEIRRWNIKGMISWDELRHLEASVLTSSLAGL